MTIEIVIRPYSPSTDDPYIYSTWTRYAWYSPKEPIKEGKRRFFRNKSKEIKEVLSQGHIRIACCSLTPYFIVGYVVVSDNKLTWMCVKNNYRGQGIEDLLLKSMKDKINEDRDTGSGTVPEEPSPKETP